jgi:SAM-dependent methyltransferase
MEFKEKQVRELFKWYSSKKLDEYGLLINEIPITPHQYVTNKGFMSGVVDTRAINKFSPDKVDNNLFWSEAINTFNLFPISGAKCDNVDELNKLSISMGVYLNTTNQFISLLRKERQNIRFLEIGPGYGGVHNLINEINSLIPTFDYYAIDVNPLFECDKLFKTDGKTIPEHVPSVLDMVYSVNVFQHLTPNQRKSYYQQIYDRLIPGGEFIFSMFVENEHNKDLNVWGYKDKTGRNYVHFFNQFTAVDTYPELETVISKVGFTKLEQLIDNDQTKNYYSFKATK